MSFDRNISSTQIVWAVGLLIGLAAAVVVGSAIGNQDFAKVSLIIGAGVGIFVMLLLGNKYWLLIPFSLAATKLPTIPFGGRTVELPELAIVACSVMFFLRLASRKEKLIVWRPASISILLFMAWVGMVFAMNPVGLAAMGSGVGGGRFYLKLALAFAAFLILSSRKYSEKDMRWVIGFIIFGAFFSLAYGFVSYALAGPSIDTTTGMVQDEFYTWHQELSVPGFTIAFLIFARFKPREVFSLQRPWLPILYFLCCLMVLISGKRLAMAMMFLPPFMGAVLHRQFVYIFVASALATVGLSVVVFGHGQWFNLPLVAQRTVSWLPGDWDPEFQGMKGGVDDWRAELRVWAAESVKRDPWIGRGFAIDLSEAIGAVLTGERGGDMNIQVARDAIGRSWHNTWLGYAADFGIPLSVIQAVLYLTILVLSYRCFRYYGTSSLFGVFAMYLLIFTVRDLIASHTSGHSALDAWHRWWMYGILVSVYYTLPKRKKSAPLPVSVPSSQREPAPAMALPTQGRAALTGTSPWPNIPGRH
jgi:hypothetical protein